VSKADFQYHLWSLMVLI